MTDWLIKQIVYLKPFQSINTSYRPRRRVTCSIHTVSFAWNLTPLLQTGNFVYSVIRPQYGILKRSTLHLEYWKSRELRFVRPLPTAVRFLEGNNARKADTIAGIGGWIPKTPQTPSRTGLSITLYSPRSSTALVYVVLLVMLGRRNLSCLTSWLFSICGWLSQPNQNFLG